MKITECEQRKTSKKNTTRGANATLREKKQCARAQMHEKIRGSLISKAERSNEHSCACISTY